LINEIIYFIKDLSNLQSLHLLILKQNTMKTKFILISLLFFFAQHTLQAQIITTVAGGDTTFFGNGGPAVNAQLSAFKIAADGLGNLYISDGGLIRKISSSGIISTIGGGGSNSNPVNGISATDAKFWVESMAVDSIGNIYITNESLRKVIKINTSGIISIVAGNGTVAYSGDGSLATSTGIGASNAVAVDHLGNIYISDAHDAVVRKVNTSGIINRYAGNGSSGYSGDGGPATSAQLSIPYTLAIDKLGNLFIKDLLNGVRKVNSAGIISTVATNIYPNDLSTDNSGNLYIAAGAKVLKLDTTGVISTIAGTGSAGFSGDGGLATSAQVGSYLGVTLDSASNIYIADGENKRIRKINSSGIISTIAGNGYYSYSGDGQPAIKAALGASDNVAADRFGNFYMADATNNLVRKVNSSGIISTIAGNGTSGFSGDSGLAVNAQLNRPSNVAVDSTGNLYINDAGNSRIRKVNTSGTITTIAGNGTNGNTGDSAAATAAAIRPTRIAVDKSGNIYFTQKNNVRKIDLNGIITTMAGTGTFGYSGDDSLATNAKLGNPTGITVDDSENVYITDYTNRIRKISNAGIISTIAGNGTNGYSGDGGIATAAGLALGYSSGIATDHFGNVFIADEGNSVVRQVDKAGIITTVAGNNTNGYSGDGGQATSAELYFPEGLATDRLGNLYISQGGGLRNAVIRFVNFGRSLPLSILRFNGYLANEIFSLQWQSANEVNTKNFIIQRSSNGTTFTDLGTVKSANTSGTNSYNFIDNHPLQSINYYRLKMEDNDGRFTYSNIIPIKLSDFNTNLFLYPNPAHNAATVLFNSIGNNKYAINITDLTGRLIKRVKGISTLGTNTIAIDVKNFSKGTYFINMNNENGRQSIKFSKQ